MVIIKHYAYDMWSPPFSFVRILLIIHKISILPLFLIFMMYLCKNGNKTNKLLLLSPYALLLMLSLLSHPLNFSFYLSISLSLTLSFSCLVWRRGRWIGRRWRTKKKTEETWQETSTKEEHLRGKGSHQVPITILLVANAWLMSRKLLVHAHSASDNFYEMNIIFLMLCVGMMSPGRNICYD